MCTGMPRVRRSRLGVQCAHHSVATLLLAMAEPQPKVLKHDSTMRPSSSTCNEDVCHHMPGAGRDAGNENQTCLDSTRNSQIERVLSAP